MGDEDNERLYSMMTDLTRQVRDNHTEVVQRLSRLEGNQHTPIDCPGLSRLEDVHRDCVQTREQLKRDNAVKSVVKEAARTIAAAITALLTALSFGGGSN